MKKKIWIPIVIALIAILFIPIPSGVYDDGGTKEYTALTYKIVRWNRLTEYGIYNKLRVYVFPNNFKSLNSSWAQEEAESEHSFIATVLEIGESSVLVEPFPDSIELKSSDRISFAFSGLENLGVEVGSVVKVTYTGVIMESYPAQINATSWQLSNDLRHMEYTGQWLDKNKAEKVDYDLFTHIKITRIYSDCFFARTVIPMPYEIKLNGNLSEDWCVGDQITCTYENTYYDKENERVETDMLTVQASDWRSDSNVCYKPVIYLYPETETEVFVKLTLDGRFTCTYPKYTDGWAVTAAPDGTLTDKNGQTYNYLYWEGETYAKYDMSKGFCVKGEDTAAFLEIALERLGLTRREANEFIVYWLPQMEPNPYNIISFQTDAYTAAAELKVTPKPDTLIRVFMAWKRANTYISLPEQELNTVQRSGFTAVEWGGTEIQ